MRREMKVKQQRLPVRCEICHQADFFDPINNSCSRCQNLSLIVEKQEDVGARKWLARPYVKALMEYKAEQLLFAARWVKVKQLIIKPLFFILVVAAVCSLCTYLHFLTEVFGEVFSWVVKSLMSLVAVVIFYLMVSHVGKLIKNKLKANNDSINR